MRPPMLLIGHGSRQAAGAKAFLALVDRVRGRLDGDVRVEGGFIELSEPLIAPAVAGLYAAGARHLVTVPLVLVAAGHDKTDVPAIMNAERERLGALTYTYGRPLGPHPAMLAMVEHRIDAALSGAGRVGTTVVLVGRGSTDPDANAEITKVARLVWEGRGYDAVEPAFISLTSPGLPAALDRARLLGAGRIVVAPYFLFPGVLPDRLVDQAGRWAGENPGVDLRVAEVIGDCDGLAELVLERYEEALSGDIRMNCDTCVYRRPMPGFEHLVGAPQEVEH